MVASPAPGAGSIANRDRGGRVKERLRAAQDGRPMEAELRAITAAAMEAPTRAPGVSLYDRTWARVEPLGGIELAAVAGAVFEQDRGGPVLPFDARAAASHAALLALRRRPGRPMGPPDPIVAAAAHAHRAAIATREAGGFEGCGLAVVDPWQA